MTSPSIVRYEPVAETMGMYANALCFDVPFSRSAFLPKTEIVTL